MYRNKKYQKHGVDNPLMKSLLQRLEADRNIGYNISVEIIKLAKCFANELNFSDEEKRNFILLVKLHDIGKLSLPENIIFKKDSLNEKEWENYKSHVEVGYNITSSFRGLEEISNYILHHHEAWDGSGYPFGKRGDDIPFMARALTVLDVYISLVQDIYYPLDKDQYFTEVLSKGQARDKIESLAGNYLDPSLVEQFLDII